MITLTSRYASGEVLFVRDPKNGTTIPTVFRSTMPIGTASLIYKWKTGDRPDTLGKRMNNKAHLWWQTFDKNSEYIDPLRVPPGASVVVQ